MSVSACSGRRARHHKSFSQREKKKREGERGQEREREGGRMQVFLVECLTMGGAGGIERELLVWVATKSQEGKEREGVCTKTLRHILRREPPPACNYNETKTEYTHTFTHTQVEHTLSANRDNSRLLCQHGAIKHSRSI